MHNRTPDDSRFIWRLAPALLALSLGGCSAGNLPKFGPLPREETSRVLPFLRDGVTSRAECLARFGEPKRVFDHGTILIYGSANYGVPIGFTELVLAFDAQGVLRRHALILEPRYNFISDK